MSAVLQTPSIADMLATVQQEASVVVARHQKHASVRLYRILARCLEIVERADRDPSDRSALDAALRAQDHDGNRRYVERGSETAVLVCRYVFHGHEHQANAYRYAVALRVAAGMQIGSGQLEAWLRSNGGVNALYFRRDTLADVGALKTLRLLSAVSFPRDRPFTLTLRWTSDNAFQVLRGSEDGREDA